MSGKANCKLCSAEVDAEDSFCYGCEAHICEDCDANVSLPMGRHYPQDHAADEDEE